MGDKERKKRSYRCRKGNYMMRYGKNGYGRRREGEEEEEENDGEKDKDKNNDIEECCLLLK